APAHSLVPPSQVGPHLPTLQTWFAAQALKHSPQLSLSTERSWPGHTVTHSPLLQAWVAVQVSPHSPQFSGSNHMSTHWFEQVAVAPPQPGPAQQTWPSAHSFERLPQWLASVCVSTHCAEHSVLPPWHFEVHLPSVQTSSAAQALEQAPQLAWS